MGAAWSGEDVGIHVLAGFRGLTIEEELRSLIRAYRIGGIVLFRRNIESPEQLKALIEAAQRCAGETLGRPLWIAIDQEGGPVQRLGTPWTRLPAARELAAAGSEAVRRWATLAARELRELGIQMNFAPVLDVLPHGEEEAEHFMAARSLGADPARVAELGRIWIRALQDRGVSATAKHFPGLGQARLDPHHYAPVISWGDEAAMERDLIPFQAAIGAGVHGVMTSHAHYPLLDAQWPATLSSTISRDWLRGRLGFSGVLLSDDMDMAAMAQHFDPHEIVTQGLRATIDFFLSCQDSERIPELYAALFDAVRSRSDCGTLHAASIERIGCLFRSAERTA